MPRTSIAVLFLSVSLWGCGASESAEQVDVSQAASKPQTRPRLIDQMAEVDSLGWVKTLGQLYPEEYERLGNHLEAASNEQADVVHARMDLAVQVQPFMTARKRSIRSASDVALVEYLKRNATVLERLSNENPTACIEVAQGRLNPAVQLSDSVWTAMSDATSQLLVAAKEAEDTPAHRPNANLTIDEQRSWMVEVGNAGATPRTAELLTDPAAASAATPEELCRVRILLMRGAILAAPSTAAKVVLSTG